MTAKKRKKKNKRTSKKQHKSRLDSGKKALLDRLLSDQRVPRNPVVVEPPGVEKMSEVIKDFAKPLLDQCEDNESAKGVIALAIAAWNTSLLPEEEQEEAVEEAFAAFSRSIPDGFLAAFKADLRMLLDRKKTHFAHIHRDIIDFEFTEQDGRIGFDVVSSLHVGG